MLAARLHGARDLHVERVPEPGEPGPGEVTIRVSAVGVCGSDLHTYNEGRIGTTRVVSPLVLGHEFAGVVTRAGELARSGAGTPLVEGVRVAVDPHVPCRRCEWCERGHPNLCPEHAFYGVWPFDGALQELMTCDSRNCFPLPDSVSDVEGALLEPLGVAIHSLDLGKVRIGDTAVVLGCGPIGLLIAWLARRAGASQVLAFDKYPWRSGAARRWGAGEGLPAENEAVARMVLERTSGRGADVVFEAAWAGPAVQQAVEAARPGGRVVLVGIPDDDRFELRHSDARRKGLTMSFARRMKHTYPRAIALAEGDLELEALVTHRFRLDQAAEAFALNAGYQDGVLKAMILPASDGRRA
jgi:L-iditol 2-dehydrogenase